MKVFVSTEETQGIRKNDFCFVPEGELVMSPVFVCHKDTENPDGNCGCNRALCGLESSKATTTAKVAEVTMDEKEFTAKAMESFIKGWGEVRSVILKMQYKDDIERILEAAKKFTTGTVVEYRDGVFAAR